MDGDNHEQNREIPQALRNLNRDELIQLRQLQERLQELQVRRQQLQVRRQQLQENQQHLQEIVQEDIPLRGLTSERIEEFQHFVADQSM